jgi:hypothetical protein
VGFSRSRGEGQRSKTGQKANVKGVKGKGKACASWRRRLVRHSAKRGGGRREGGKGASPGCIGRMFGGWSPPLSLRGGVTVVLGLYRAEAVPHPEGRWPTVPAPKSGRIWRTACRGGYQVGERGSALTHIWGCCVARRYVSKMGRSFVTLVRLENHILRVPYKKSAICCGLLLDKADRGAHYALRARGQTLKPPSLRNMARISRAPTTTLASKGVPAGVGASRIGRRK